MRVNSFIFVALCALASPLAAAPRVVADIPPLHALAAEVMRGIGAPELILPPGAHPHDYAMRPSEAALLGEADMVFWIGPGLTPWLATAIESLATEAVIVELGEAEGVRHLAFRSGATFEHHDLEEEIAADDHAEDHGHGHEGEDPHVWLDPVNAQAMLGAIAAALTAADPANAGAYKANAAAASARIDRLIAEVAAQLAPAQGAPFIVFHDAYHYFEARFGIEAAGAIAISDAATPGPARLDEVRRLVSDLDVACVFTEPQFDTKLANLIAEGTGARIAELDPLGADIPPGPDLYAALIRNLGASLAGCLSAR
ncbi:MAG: zinc ABC transporter substrate-binding protein [Paracoccaceae bacterium]